jgi:methionyl aminopeptidase
MTLIKTPAEIEQMRSVAQLTASLFGFIEPFIKEGTTTLEINDRLHDKILSLGATPAPLEKGFPKAVCISLNEVICHGIPSERRLKKGDIFNIDISIKKDGFYGDTSKMYAIDPVPSYARRLIDLTQLALYEAIAHVRPGQPLNRIGAAIQSIADKHHLSIVEEFCGHGIGRALHEAPQVLHYKNNHGLILEPGMIFTIEPMINLGKKHLKILGDGWTAVTKDRSLSAQWEHTILVTDTGCEVLSRRDEESF